MAVEDEPQAKTKVGASMKTLFSKSEEKDYIGGFIFPKQEIGSTTKFEWKYVCDICGKEEITKESVYIGLYTGLMRMGDWPRNMSIKEWGLKPSRFVACDSHTEKEMHEYTRKQLEA